MQGAHRDLHVLTPSSPTRAASSLSLRAVPAARDGFDTGRSALAVRFVAGFFFADFLAVDFFAVGFFAVGFLAVDLLAVVLPATFFFAALRTVFFVTFFAAFPAVFFAAFRAACFGADFRVEALLVALRAADFLDRKSTHLNSSH